ncbi:cleavage and polyadenylation specificity factor subunit 2, partial [Perkinsus olseni]
MSQVIPTNPEGGVSVEVLPISKDTSQYQMAVLKLTDDMTGYLIGKMLLFSTVLVVVSIRKYSVMPYRDVDRYSTVYVTLRLLGWNSDTGKTERGPVGVWFDSHRLGSRKRLQGCIVICVF